MDHLDLTNWICRLQEKQLQHDDKHKSIIETLVNEFQVRWDVFELRDLNSCDLEDFDDFFPKDEFKQTKEALKVRALAKKVIMEAQAQKPWGTSAHDNCSISCVTGGPDASIGEVSQLNSWEALDHIVRSPTNDGRSPKSLTNQCKELSPRTNGPSTTADEAYQSSQSEAHTTKEPAPSSSDALLGSQDSRAQKNYVMKTKNKNKGWGDEMMLSESSRSSSVSNRDDNNSSTHRPQAKAAPSSINKSTKTIVMKPLRSPQNNTNSILSPAGESPSIAPPSNPRADPPHFELSNEDSIEKRRTIISPHQNAVPTTKPPPPPANHGQRPAQQNPAGIGQSNTSTRISSPVNKQQHQFSPEQSTSNSHQQHITTTNARGSWGNWGPHTSNNGWGPNRDHPPYNNKSNNNLYGQLSRSSLELPSTASSNHGGSHDDYYVGGHGNINGNYEAYNGNYNSNNYRGNNHRSNHGGKDGSRNSMNSMMNRRGNSNISDGTHPGMLTRENMMGGPYPPPSTVSSTASIDFGPGGARGGGGSRMSNCNNNRSYNNQHVMNQNVNNNNNNNQSTKDLLPPWLLQGRVCHRLFDKWLDLGRQFLHRHDPLPPNEKLDIATSDISIQNLTDKSLRSTPTDPLNSIYFKNIVAKVLTSEIAVHLLVNHMPFVRLGDGETRYICKVDKQKEIRLVSWQAGQNVWMYMTNGEYNYDMVSDAFEAGLWRCPSTVNWENKDRITVLRDDLPLKFAMAQCNLCAVTNITDYRAVALLYIEMGMEASQRVGRGSLSLDQAVFLFERASVASVMSLFGNFQNFASPEFTIGNSSNTLLLVGRNLLYAHLASPTDHIFDKNQHGQEFDKKVWNDFHQFFNLLMGAVFCDHWQKLISAGDEAQAAKLSLRLYSLIFFLGYNHMIPPEMWGEKSKFMEHFVPKSKLSETLKSICPNSDAAVNELLVELAKQLALCQNDDLILLAFGSDAKAIKGEVQARFTLARDMRTTSPLTQPHLAELQPYVMMLGHYTLSWHTPNAVSENEERRRLPRDRCVHWLGDASKCAKCNRNPILGGRYSPMLGTGPKAAGNICEDCFENTMKNSTDAPMYIKVPRLEKRPRYDPPRGSAKTVIATSGAAPVILHQGAFPKMAVASPVNCSTTPASSSANKGGNSTTTTKKVEVITRPTPKIPKLELKDLVGVWVGGMSTEELGATNIRYDLQLSKDRLIVYNELKKQAIGTITKEGTKVNPVWYYTPNGEPKVKIDDALSVYLLCFTDGRRPWAKDVIRDHCRKEVVQKKIKLANYMRLEIGCHYEKDTQTIGLSSCMYAAKSKDEVKSMDKLWEYTMLDSKTVAAMDPYDESKVLAGLPEMALGYALSMAKRSTYWNKASGQSKCMLFDIQFKFTHWRQENLDFLKKCLTNSIADGEEKQPMKRYVIGKVNKLKGDLPGARYEVSELTSSRLDGVAEKTARTLVASSYDTEVERWWAQSLGVNNSLLK